MYNASKNLLSNFYLRPNDVKEEAVHIHFSQFFNALQRWRFKFYQFVEAFWFIPQPL